MIALLLSLLKPLQNALSPGGARVRLGCTGTHYDSIAAEMEGYTRALWGLAPLLAAEPDRIEFRDLAESWRKGLESGTNPENEEYWGECDDKDQRFVEMAAIVSLWFLDVKYFGFVGLVELMDDSSSLTNS